MCVRYVENVLGLLDSPLEWFVDDKTRTLYFFPDTSTADTATSGEGRNRGDIAPEGVFEAPVLESLVIVRGHEDAPAVNVTL